MNNNRIFETGTATDKANFSFILTNHLNRIALIGAMLNKPLFINSVDILDVLLEAYKDSIFDLKKEKLKEELKRKINSIEPTKRNAYVEDLTYEYSKELLRELYKLMCRKDLLPSRKVIVDDVDADD